MPILTADFAGNQFLSAERLNTDYTSINAHIHDGTSGTKISASNVTTGLSGAGVAAGFGASVLDHLRAVGTVADVSATNPHGTRAANIKTSRTGTGLGGGFGLTVLDHINATGSATVTEDNPHGMALGDLSEFTIPEATALKRIDFPLLQTTIMEDNSQLVLVDADGDLSFNTPGYDTVGDLVGIVFPSNYKIRFNGSTKNAITTETPFIEIVYVPNKTTTDEINWRVVFTRISGDTGADFTVTLVDTSSKTANLPLNKSIDLTNFFASISDGAGFQVKVQRDGGDAYQGNGGELMLIAVRFGYYSKYPA